MSVMYQEVNWADNIVIDYSVPGLWATIWGNIDLLSSFEGGEN